MTQSDLPITLLLRMMYIVLTLFYSINYFYENTFLLAACDPHLYWSL
jgi:hypothetical protein